MKHLFLIWQAAQHVRAQILEDLATEFQMQHVSEVTWTPMQFDYALARFYGGGIGDKGERCGRGPFTAAIVDDPMPMMGYDSSDRHGSHWVNLRAKQAKLRYRTWASDGPNPVCDYDYVHASDTEEDTRRDVVLLFGCPPDELPAGSWKWMHDLVGIPSYADMAEVYRVLNAGIEYVVLREDHKDVDLLVADRAKAALLLGATPLFADPLRTAHVINVAGKYRFLDLRYVGDGYYDTAWEKAMLKTRVNEEMSYRLSADHRFYGLYYHALIHKPALPYQRHLELQVLSDLHGFPYHRRALDDWMRAHSYRYTRPVDWSVCFNEAEVPMPTFGDQIRHKWRLVQHALNASV